MSGQGMPPGKLSHRVIKRDLAFSSLGWELPVVKISRCFLLALLVSPENSWFPTWEIYARLGFLEIEQGKRAEAATLHQACFYEGEEINTFG